LERDASSFTPWGWYPDPFAPDLLRLWDGRKWTELTTLLAVEETDGRLRPHHPLSRGARPHLARTILNFTLLWLPVVLVTWALQARFPEPTYTVERTLISNPGVFVLIYFAFLARRVDYRWFDTFWLLVPVIGAIVAIKIVWRNAKLPYRNWSPRREVLEAEPVWQESNARASALMPRAYSGVVEGDAERP